MDFSQERLMKAELHALNDQYCIPGQISFHAGAGGLAMAVINNLFGTATVTLAGAHVMTYQPHFEREVLWTSPSAAYELKIAMRGGIPVCWPWFANHPSDPGGIPFHGLVRTQVFRVCETKTLKDGETGLRLCVKDTPCTRVLWPYAYEMEVNIHLGKSLRVEWTARNPGSEGYTYTGALHPYFSVSNVHDLTMRGLEGTKYLDKYNNNRCMPQNGPIRFSGRIDNVYLDTTADIALEDPGFQRTIHVRKNGSRTSVVWNPDEDDTLMPGVGEGQHQFFVCIESANAANDIVTVEPGGEAQLGMEIEIEPWRSS